MSLQFPMKQASSLLFSCLFARSDICLRMCFGGLFLGVAGVDADADPFPPVAVVSERSDVFAYVSSSRSNGGIFKPF